VGVNAFSNQLSVAACVTLVPLCIVSSKDAQRWIMLLMDTVKINVDMSVVKTTIVAADVLRRWF